MSTTPSTVERPTAEAYRPLHPASIVAVVLALCSLSIFVFEWLWLLILFAVPAIVVGAFARWRIARAHDVWAGQAVAGVGIVIALVSLLGFSTRQVLTSWVIHRESRAFLEQFLHKLQEGKEGEAFLDSLAPDSRQIPFRPDDLQRLRVHFRQGGYSMFDVFRKDQFISLMLRYGARARWEHRGSSTPFYNKGRYTLAHRYAIFTPQEESQVDLHVSGEMVQVGEGSVRRMWRFDRVDFVPDESKRGYTPYGRQLYDAYLESTKTLYYWTHDKMKARVQHILKGDTPTAQSICLSPGEQRELAALQVTAWVGWAFPGIPQPAPFVVVASPVEQFAYVFNTFSQELARHKTVNMRPSMPDAYLLDDRQERDLWHLRFSLPIQSQMFEISTDVWVVGMPGADKQGGTPLHVSEYRVRGIYKLPEPGVDAPP